MPTTGERIRDARKALGLTQTELAEKVGVKFAAIHKYETGLVVNLKRDTVSALAHALNVSPSWLMCIEDDPTEKTAAPQDDGLSPLEAQLLSIYRSVNGQGQRYIMKQAEFAAAQEEYRPAPPKSGATAAG